MSDINLTTQGDEAITLTSDNGDIFILESTEDEFILDAGFTGPRGPQGDIGPRGLQGQQGSQGQKGDTGVGLPTGGAANQVLTKRTNTDFDIAWVDPNVKVLGVSLKDTNGISWQLGVDTDGALVTTQGLSNQYGSSYGIATYA